MPNKYIIKPETEFNAAQCFKVVQKGSEECAIPITSNPALVLFLTNLYKELSDILMPMLKGAKIANGIQVNVDSCQRRRTIPVKYAISIACFIAVCVYQDYGKESGDYYSISATKQSITFVDALLRSSLSSASLVPSVATVGGCVEKSMRGQQNS